MQQHFFQCDLFSRDLNAFLTLCKDLKTVFRQLMVSTSPNHFIGTISLALCNAKLNSWLHLARQFFNSLFLKALKLFQC